MAAGSMVVLKTPDTQSLMPDRLNSCLGDAGHSVIDALPVVLAKQSHCNIILPALYHATSSIIRQVPDATGVPPLEHGSMKPR